MRGQLGVLAAILWMTPGAPAAGPTLPSEFETADSGYSNLFSYFGGVAAYSSTVDSATTIHSGGSLRVNAAFQHDAFFHTAGFALGDTIGITSPALAVPANADTFSLTIKAPMSGTLQFLVTIREDDNNDGALAAADGDDQWETDPVVIQPGTNVYNVPLSAFLLGNPGEGNGVQNFASTPRMAFFLTFETRSSLPGGIIEAPVTFWLDHAGFYTSAQSIPSGCRADFDRNGQVQPADVSLFVGTWLTDLVAGTRNADFDGDQQVLPADVSAFVSAWYGALVNGC